MPGLIGKKIGMTSVFSADGKNVPCTVIEVGPCVVTQVKTVDTEFKGCEVEHQLDETITVEIFEEGGYVDIVGTSKGKGYQGVVKRHGFGGVGQSTHGQHNRLRAPGSVGACSYPAKVFKGMRMAGQMGNERVTVQNLQVLKVIPEHNVLMIKGSIPGSKGSIVIIEK